MNESKAQEETFITAIFEDKSLFEKHVLNVFSDADRLDIMQILSKQLIREDLKEELNFLYIEDFSNFKFSLIINLLFRTIAGEWVGFAQDQFAYTREEALDEIQDRKRVKFIFSIVKNYFRVYKIEYINEIVETFMELVAKQANPQLDNKIIKDVLRSDLVKRNRINVVHNYQQLHSRIKEAYNLKNFKISELQNKISETTSKLENTQLKQSELEGLRVKLEGFENEEIDLEDSSLTHFDKSLERVKETIVNAMLEIDSLESMA